MQINIDKLKIDITNYNKLIEEYESIYLNYYHEMESNISYWTSPYANSFFSTIEEEKKENINFYQELLSLKEVLNYIITSYQKYGRKVNCNLNQKDSIINKINNYNIDEIINSYNELDLNLYPNIKEKIDKHKTKLSNSKKNKEKYKQKIKQYFNSLEEIEKEIKIKLSKITIKPIKENTILEHQLGTTTEIKMDIDEIENSIKKAKMYIEQEELNYEELKETFKNIKYNYLTDNRDLLENIGTNILLKYKTIINNYNNNIIILNNNIERFKQSIKIANNFAEEISSIIKE